MSEAATNIGLRTQSIQLMRDAMYRICEGYLSGAIDNIAYETLHRRMQSSMVAILAIEQLTGVVKAAGVQLSGSAIVGSAELLAKYTELSDKTRKDIAAAKATLEEARDLHSGVTKDRETKEARLTEIDELLKDVDPAAYNDEQKKLVAEREGLVTSIPEVKESEEKAKEQLDIATANLQELEEDLESYESTRRAVRSGTGSTTTVAVVVPDDTRSRSDAAIQAIADDVKEIVAKTLNLNFSAEVCTSILGVAFFGADQSNSILTQCGEFLKESIDNAAAQNEAIRAQIAVVRALTASATGAQGAATIDALEAAQEQLNEMLERGDRIFMSQ